jgi:hypothetical protein
MSELGLSGLVYVRTNVAEVINALGALGRSLPSVVGFAAKDTGRNIKLDLQRTTRTWNHRPEFVANVLNQGDGFMIMAGTEDAVWNMLDAGTPPHEITPRKPGGTLIFPWGGKGSYVAKSMPNWIGSQAGGPTGDTVVLRHVHHPGTTARRWSSVLSTKYAVQAPITLVSYLEKWSKG